MLKKIVASLSIFSLLATTALAGPREVCLENCAAAFSLCVNAAGGTKPTEPVAPAEPINYCVDPGPEPENPGADYLNKVQQYIGCMQAYNNALAAYNVALAAYVNAALAYDAALAAYNTRRTADLVVCAYAYTTCLDGCPAE